MWGNPRQSWIVDSKPGIPDSTYWIPVFVSGTWIPDSNRFGIRISWVVFRILKPRIPIPDSTSNNFPVFGIQIRFHGHDTVDHQGGRERDIRLSLHVLVLTNFMFSILKWWFLRATFASTFSTPIYNERKNWFFVCTMPSKNCWKALSKRFHVSSNIKGIHPQTQKLEAPCTA